MNGNQEERAINILEKAGILSPDEVMRARAEIEIRQRAEHERWREWAEKLKTNSVGLALIDAEMTEIGRVLYDEENNTNTIRKIVIDADQLDRLGFEIYLHHQKNGPTQASLVYVGEPDERVFWARLR